MLRHNKLKSIKTWALIWACGIITYAIFADKTEWANVVMTLTAVPISYSYFNLKSKELFLGKNNEES
jgi:hypothetical protein